MICPGMLVERSVAHLCGVLFLYFFFADLLTREMGYDILCDSKAR